VETSVTWIGKHLQFISVVVGLLVSLSLTLVRYPYCDRLTDLLRPCLTAGFAAGHLPTFLFLIICALDPVYLTHLETQRIQLALGGIALTLYVLDVIIERFRSDE
jgi:hypothetical protein